MFTTRELFLLLLLKAVANVQYKIIVDVDVVEGCC